MKIENYKNFGRCVVIERAGVKVMITIDIGPRIIYYGTDKFNFFGEDIDRNVSKGGEYFDKEYKKGERWYLYGGHRVWKSPEDLSTYTPDNYPVRYEMSDEYSGNFYCDISQNYAYRLSVSVDKNGGLSVENAVKTIDCVKKYHVWALSVMCKGGVLRVPLNDKTDDLNPKQNYVLWPYDNLKDERLQIDENTLTLHQTDNASPFKIGLYSKKGRAYYTVGDTTLKITCDTINEEGKYPDFGCNFETYTNNHILEIEWLGKENHGEDEGVLKERFEIIKTPEVFG